MAAPSDLLARQLADEFERRASTVAVLDPGARGALFEEFRSRLAASGDPEQLAQNWRKNADHYVQRAVDRNRAQTGPTRLTDDLVSREFHACSEVCPPPENPLSRTR
jgi:hypothetical protein